MNILWQNMHRHEQTRPSSTCTLPVSSERRKSTGSTCVYLLGFVSCGVSATEYWQLEKQKFSCTLCASQHKIMLIQYYIYKYEFVAWQLCHISLPIVVLSLLSPWFSLVLGISSQLIHFKIFQTIVTVCYKHTTNKTLDLIFIYTVMWHCLTAFPCGI